MSTSFGITWDYRCPFARNMHDHLVAALQDGAPWEVQFLAFSLDQAHVEEGEPSVFDSPERFPGLLANCAGIVVRDRQPDQFLAVHHALFEARHRGAADLRDREVLGRALDAAGVDGASVLDEIDGGWPYDVHRKEHEAGVRDHEVFGVPTFILGDRATFVRIMDRADGDGAKATATITRILDLMGDWPELNELKHTTIAH